MPDYSEISIDEREREIYPALERFARCMNWTRSEAIWFWEGGEHNPEKQCRLDADLKAEGFNCDSDDPICWSNWFYEKKILNIYQIEVLQLPFKHLKRFMICWGEGYSNSFGEACVEEHGIDFLENEGNAYPPEAAEKANLLSIGGSFELPDLTAIQSIVRIK